VGLDPVEFHGRLCGRCAAAEDFSLKCSKDRAFKESILNGNLTQAELLRAPVHLFCEEDPVF
jgi:hypothetical protein